MVFPDPGINQFLIHCDAMDVHDCVPYLEMFIVAMLKLLELMLVYVLKMNVLGSCKNGHNG